MKINNNLLQIAVLKKEKKELIYIKNREVELKKRKKLFSRNKKLVNSIITFKEYSKVFNNIFGKYVDIDIEDFNFELKSYGFDIYKINSKENCSKRFTSLGNIEYNAEIFRVYNENLKDFKLGLITLKNNLNKENEHIIKKLKIIEERRLLIELNYKNRIIEKARIGNLYKDCKIKHLLEYMNLKGICNIDINKHITICGHNNNKMLYVYYNGYLNWNIYTNYMEAHGDIKGIKAEEMISIINQLVEQIK